MKPTIQYLTAKTEEGREALSEVMQRSYRADISAVPPSWARVRLVDGVPVSFILVDPDRRLEFPQGDMRYAFICDAATREDRRGEGHFRAILQDTFECLRAAGIALVILHGRYPLYRRFGFEVFTHHCGLFIKPEQIRTRLGTSTSGSTRELLSIEDHRFFYEDLLVVAEVRAHSAQECCEALATAGALAQERGKTRILFEHPSALSYGSRYRFHASPETAFTRLALACGAQMCLQGADPESGTVPDADWVKVLDAASCVSEALRLQPLVQPLPASKVSLVTDAGMVMIQGSGLSWEAREGADGGAVPVKMPSSALAQLVTGYQPIETLAAMHKMALSPDVIALLAALFPPRWRFSRNESWVFRS